MLAKLGMLDHAASGGIRPRVIEKDYVLISDIPLKPSLIAIL